MFLSDWHGNEKQDKPLILVSTLCHDSHTACLYFVPDLITQQALTFLDRRLNLHQKMEIHAASLNIVLNKLTFTLTLEASDILSCLQNHLSQFEVFFWHSRFMDPPRTTLASRDEFQFRKKKVNTFISQNMPCFSLQQQREDNSGDLRLWSQGTAQWWCMLIHCNGDDRAKLAMTGCDVTGGWWCQTTDNNDASLWQAIRQFELTLTTALIGVHPHHSSSSEIVSCLGQSLGFHRGAVAALFVISVSKTTCKN